MSTSNATVAAALRRYASTLAIEGADRFKIKAYQRAADTVDRWGKDIGQMVAQHEPLTNLPGVGKAISNVITEVIETGQLAALERRIEALSPEQAELSSKPQLDVKRVLRVYKKLGLRSLEDLQQALDSGRLQEQIDSRTLFHIRQGLSDRRRTLLWEADKIALPILTFLEESPDVASASIVGSVRRRQETVGDLNFLAATPRPAPILRALAGFGGLERIETPRADCAEYRLSTGVKITLAAVQPSHWGSGLVQHTGSAAHLAELQRVTRAKGVKKPKRTLRKTVDEAAHYKQFGLPIIPPELREGLGEVQAAVDGTLPRLVAVADIRGDLHMHTTASDGANSLEQMAEAAEQRGYSYIAITDHSQSLKIANGLTKRRLLAQARAIDRFNARHSHVRVLKAAEVDILEDGTLDYSDDVLRELDLTICSIHSRFALAKQAQTDRLLRALDNRYLTILGHATGRKLLQREGYDVDMEQVLRRARANGCFVEINANPNRLDLSDDHARMAKGMGLLIAINTDAHNTRELEFMPAGINQARRAWLEPKNVLNTLDLPRLLRRLRQRR